MWSRLERGCCWTVCYSNCVRQVVYEQSGTYVEDVPFNVDEYMDSKVERFSIERRDSESKIVLLTYYTRLVRTKTFESGCNSTKGVSLLCLSRNSFRSDDFQRAVEQNFD
jgi:hypothetical protein